LTDPVRAALDRGRQAIEVPGAALA